MHCQYTCNLQTTNLDGFCLEEYEALLWCKADGGYACDDGLPRPQVDCFDEGGSYADCIVDLGCKRWCADSIDAGCEPGPLEACVDTCNAARDELPGGCGVLEEAVLKCKVNTGQICIDEAEPVGPDCAGSATDVAKCIHDATDDTCQAHCYIADALGCGTDCVAECEASIADGTCAAALADLVGCEIRGPGNHLACEDGRLVGIDRCESESAAYDACVDR
jgi:hypothetical protein